VRKFEFAHGNHRDFKIRRECDLGLSGTHNRQLAKTEVQFRAAAIIKLQASMTPISLNYKYVAPQLLTQHSFLFQGTGW
jgi:hypothetical protein